MTPEVTIDNTIRNEVGVIDQIDMVTDKRFNVMSISGKGIAMEVIFL
jgi:hypothetical protein